MEIYTVMSNLHRMFRNITSDQNKYLVSKFWHHELAKDYIGFKCMLKRVTIGSFQVESVSL